MPTNADVNVINNKITDGTITKEKLAFTIDNGIQKLYEVSNTVPDWITLTQDSNVVSCRINGQGKIDSWSTILQSFDNQKLFIVLSYGSSDELIPPTLKGISAIASAYTVTSFSGTNYLTVKFTFNDTSLSYFSKLTIYSF